MIATHLIALLVVVPLLSAPACALLPGRRLPWMLATGVTWFLLVLAWLTVTRVLAAGSLGYEMGGWAPPWGIELRVDALNAYVALIICAIGTIVMPFARLSVEHEIAPSRIPGFYAAYLLVLTGLLGITVTGDVFNLFVFLEISSLASYVLIAMADDRRALLAAFQYLVVGTIGATFILIGIGLLYAMTGTLNMADLAARLPAVQETRTVYTAFTFIGLGASIKLALFPLHLWLPNAYTYAPSVVSAFLAATATKVALYVLLRFIFTIFGAAFVFEGTKFGWIFLILSVCAIFYGSTLAILQENVKRMLACSSIAQIGYMVAGVSMATVGGLSAGILHLFNHALMKGALFLAMGCVLYRIGSVDLSRMRGLGREMPWTMSAFAVAGLSLIGVPPTAGFISKWYLVAAALDRGWWTVAVLMLLASLLAVVYIWRVVEAAWLQPAPADRAPATEAPLILLVPTWILALANLYFGIETGVSGGVATLAARSLLGVAP